MKIIRGLWNSYELFVNEIPSKPLFDEVVYVWGVENEIFLNGLGYNTVLVSERICEYCHNTIQFLHKIECFRRGANDFNKFLFLDWDVKKEKELDQNFFNLVTKRKLSAPLYAYPSVYVNHNYNLKEFYTWDKQVALNLKKYSWFVDDMYILPNACFFYVSESRLIEDMERLIYDNNLNTLIEEFLIYKMVNCSLEEYIQEYEPLVIYGRPNHHSFIFKEKIYEVFKKTRDLVGKKLKKDIYLEHI